MTPAGAETRPIFLLSKPDFIGCSQIGPVPARPKTRALEGEAEGTSCPWTASLWVGKVHRPRCSGWTESCASSASWAPDTGLACQEVLHTLHFKEREMEREETPPSNIRDLL